MTTPIITTALARKPRRNPHAIRPAGGEGGAEKGPHNYIAEGAKKTPGAPLGNRRAARRSPEDVDRHSAIDALIQRVSATADAVIALADHARAERAVLAALLREPRP